MMGANFSHRNLAVTRVEPGTLMDYVAGTNEFFKYTLGNVILFLRFYKNDSHVMTVILPNTVYLLFSC